MIECIWFSYLLERPVNRRLQQCPNVGETGEGTLAAARLGIEPGTLPILAKRSNDLDYRVTIPLRPTPSFRHMVFLPEDTQPGFFIPSPCSLLTLYEERSTVPNVGQQERKISAFTPGIEPMTLSTLTEPSNHLNTGPLRPTTTNCAILVVLRENHGVLGNYPHTIHPALLMQNSGVPNELSA